MKHNLNGLTSAEVNESRQKYGSNSLTPAETEGFWDKLANNFKDPIIIILCFALVIIFVLSLFGLTEWYEAVAIGIAVLLATFVATFSEYKNEESFQKLQEEASRINTNVIRDGSTDLLPVEEVVKGDYVLLQPGDKVPADGYVLEGNIKVVQASMTGEADAVPKQEKPDGLDISEPEPGDKYSLFRGTVVEEGEAIMWVQKVGDKTLYGKLAKELSESEQRLSPLQVKLKGLADLISRAGYVVAVLIFVTVMFQKIVIANDFDTELMRQYFDNWNNLITDSLSALVLAIIILVAAVPEGLPMMIAIVLALNMKKLLREKVLVRKLLGIETSGSVNMLFSDKTGTITKGELRATLLLDGKGDTHEELENIPPKLRHLLSYAILENTSSYVTAEGQVAGGNSSDMALLDFVKSDQGQFESSKTEQVKEVLFSSDRKFSATEVRSDYVKEFLQDDTVTLFKGAPEVIIDQCNRYFDEDGSIKEFETIAHFFEILGKYANAGIRLIAVAITEESLTSEDKPPGGGILIGLVGIRDEVRDESKPSIQQAREAGIQVIMITGDKVGTARAIADEVGMLDDQGKVLSSSDLNSMDDERIREVLPELRVIARAVPSDKSRMVRICKSMGYVVGMTGDGVNDSAALKQSDVGFAMGSGSEVSKEAGDIVILDDNFNSIANAIRYGRTIFKSIRKFIVFQLTINVAAVSLVFLGPLMGIEFPLTIIQLLWINLIMDTLGALAMGGEPALERYMKEPPVDREANILTPEMKSSILTGGLFITAFSLFFLNFDPFQQLFLRDGEPDRLVHLTAFFNLFIFLIVFNAFNIRTHKLNLFDHLGDNKRFSQILLIIAVVQIIFTYIGGKVLRTTPLLFEEWLIIIGLSLVIIPIDMIRKAIILAVQKN